ncbi:hypothetical protein IAU59_002222 [Kwoniella sp. CBS 9459]
MHDACTMTYPDNSANSVHSLLALLRSAQDNGTVPGRTQNPPLPVATSSSLQPSPGRVASQAHAGPSRAAPAIPSKRQLDDLLSSLNARPTPVSGSPVADKGEGDTTPNRQRTLIEPFGPVGQSPTPTPPVGGPRRSFDGAGHSPTSNRNAASPRGSGSGPNVSARRGSTSTPMPSPVTDLSKGNTNAEVTGSRKRPAERVGEAGYAEMSFGKALPILTELLEDDGFKAELKKMKKEQDSLERKLWAKGEKVKADHERSIQAEKEVAKIARRPIDPDKKAAWAKSLAASLNTFYLEQCLPTIDSLGTKHKQRLIELGVPGLGSVEDVSNVDPKAQERIRRVMELLEAGSED